MPPTHALNVDLAKIYTRDGDRFRYLKTIAWGAELFVREIAGDHVRIGVTVRNESGQWRRVDGFIRVPRGSDLEAADLVIERENSRLLTVEFVDVQQGDAAIVESPSGKVVLIDGGESQLFARYLATRFRDTEPTKPKEIDEIVVT
ncbi:MAG TPA: competence protein, partial [Actinomycetota bacterium]|nr:competence protein [Actinomycetota bacterium]